MLRERTTFNIAALECLRRNGVADLRGKAERERAQLIINHCAHPDYRDELQSFVNTAKEGYSPESLANTVAMHVQFLKTGDMRGTQWN